VFKNETVPVMNEKERERERERESVVENQRKKTKQT
jgi:hypothetical protein